MAEAKICESCAAKDVLITQQQKLIESLIAQHPPVAPPNLPYVVPGTWRQPSVIGVSSDPTRNCPCRPENGGSGICGCVLGGPRITCAVA